MKSNIWYVAFPLWRYNEDVLKIANEKGLQIVDCQNMSDFKQIKNAPKLTIKEIYKEDK